MTKRLPSGFQATLVRLSSWDWDILVRSSPVWWRGGIDRPSANQEERKWGKGDSEKKYKARVGEGWVTGKETEGDPWSGEVTEYTQHTTEYLRQVIQHTFPHFEKERFWDSPMYTFLNNCTIMFSAVWRGNIALKLTSEATVHQPYLNIPEPELGAVIRSAGDQVGVIGTPG